MNQVSSIPSLAELQQFSVNRRGEKEGIRQSLYDFQIYPAAGATQFTFFAQPQGQGLSSSPGFAGNAKRLADTNMTLGGNLPAPQMFLIESIEVYFFPGSVSTANTYTPAQPYAFLAVAAATFTAGVAVNDIVTVYETGQLSLLIGSKEYLQEAPLVRFCPKAKTRVDGAIASNSATTAEVGALRAAADGRPYYVDPPLLIPANQNFGVTINFPAAIATPSTFNGRIGVVMDGFLYRNSQ